MKSETDLAKYVVTWLQEQNWDIYQEVEFRKHGGIADIVAVRHNIIWIIETKMSYSFTVLEQASRWPVHFRSVAVPHSKSDRDYKVAKLYYNVGVLTVSQWGNVDEIIRPPLFYRKKGLLSRYQSDLTPLHKTYAMAGSRSGNHLTPYKRTMMDVKRVISQNPGCTIKFLHKTLGNCHYANQSSFTGSLIRALEDFEPWCRIDKSVKPYQLFIKEM